jgi:ribosomal protein S27E
MKPNNDNTWLFLGTKRGMMIYKCPNCGHEKHIVHKVQYKSTRCNLCNRELWYT